MTDTLERREAIARALAMHRFRDHKPPVRWPTAPNDTLSGRDGTVPLTWDYAERCRAEADAILAALTTSPRVDEGRAVPRIPTDAMKAVRVRLVGPANGIVDPDALDTIWRKMFDAYVATTPADPRAGKMEADLEAAKKALAKCRTNLAGYAITKPEQYMMVIRQFWAEIERIDGVARSTLSQIEGSGR